MNKIKVPYNFGFKFYFNLTSLQAQVIKLYGVLHIFKRIVCILGTMYYL